MTRLANDGGVLLAVVLAAMGGACDDDRSGDSNEAAGMPIAPPGRAGEREQLGSTEQVPPEQRSPEQRRAAGQRPSGQLPTLSEVPEFELLSEEGEPVSSSDLAGTPYVAAFMFTRCPTVCPKVTAKMKAVDAAAQKEGKELAFVSFSVDGEHDTPDVLRAYAREHGVTGPQFHFLTGDNQKIAEHAERGFKVGVSGDIDEKKPHLGLTHGSHLILVDGQGVIRGYYRSFEDGAVERLVADLDKL